jgi:hypothetical protein
MRDLHVYIDPVGPDGRSQHVVFYSRRADGPYYRWVYAEGAGRWLFSRVPLSRLRLRVLCVAPWNAVPAALRDRLGEHYLE